jgi:hypothetical protein
MRRFILLLAVPALALGFTFAPSGTGQAKAAAFPDPGFVCSIAASQIARAAYYEDWATVDQVWNLAVAAGCSPWYLM